MLSLWSIACFFLFSYFGRSQGGYLDLAPNEGGVEESYLQVTPDQVFDDDAALGGYLEMSAAQGTEDGGYVLLFDLDHYTLSRSLCSFLSEY